jgi:transcriptional regulator with PAS, ATPase and Fis domain
MQQMIVLRWRGKEAPRNWLGELRAAAVLVAYGAPVAGDALLVVRTSGKQLDAPTDVARWLWMPASRPSQDAERRAVLAGAVDVIAADEPRAVERLIARAREASFAEEPLPESDGFVADSLASRRVLRDVLRAARTSMPVLLTGETGTGKELAARLVHAWSRRRARTFVPINCAAIPDDLIEAELFGYVRGAFSGAVRNYDGQLMAAEGGTVFLDEIDDTPPTLQAKLLRVLEDRVVSRLGQNEWHHIDFRIVAATNRDLRELIQRGEFGEDLYERLAIMHVHLPPLRERLEDLTALVAHFIERYYAEEPPPSTRRVQVLSTSALAALVEYRWPGNVRELRNVVYESLARKASGEELLLSDLPRRVLERQPSRDPVATALVDESRITARLEARTMNLRQELENLERAAVLAALRLSRGHPAQAARLLGRGSSRDPAGTVRAMMRRLRIE